MPDKLNKPALLDKLKSEAETLGLSCSLDGMDSCSGQLTSIKSKWWFGGRKLIYRMACRFSEADKSVAFRESVTERSWGLPPPTVTVEKQTIKGWERSGSHTETAVGGGGSIEFERVRNAIKRVVSDAGWSFHFEGGHLP